MSLSRLTYLAAEAVDSPTFEAAEQAAEAAFPLEGMTAETLTAHFAARYHPDQYKTAIRAFVTQITGEEEGGLRTLLTGQSSSSYETFYRTTLHRLTGEIEDATAKLNAQLAETRDWVKRERALLRDQVDATRGAAAAGEAVQAGPTAGRIDKPAGYDQLPPRAKNPGKWSKEAIQYAEYVNDVGATQALFGEYVESMNEQYLSLPAGFFDTIGDWLTTDRVERDFLDQFGDTTGPELFERYRDLAARFADGMKARVRGKVAWIFFQGASPEKLTALHDEIRTDYERHLKTEQGRVHISLGELNRLSKRADFGVDINLLAAQRASDKEVIEQLDEQHRMNPDVLQTVTPAVVNNLMETAVRNGQEQAVIDFVRAYYETNLGKALPADLSFADARARLNDVTTRAARAGAATVAPILLGRGSLNDVVNGQFTRLLNRVDRKIMDDVIQTRIDLLTGKFWPNNEPDREVLAFMRSNRAGRDEILNNPARRQQLFEGIKIATTDYKARLREFKGGNPRDYARLQTLIILGEEAEALISHFGQKEAYRAAKKGFKDGAYPVDLAFQKPNEKQVNRRYVSRASMGGFNGVNLGMNAVKVWAWTTLIFNVMHSKKKSLSNEKVWLTGATLAALHYNQKTPGGLLSYPFATEAQQAFRVEHMRLNEIAAQPDLAKPHVVQFAHNLNEFGLIRAARAKKVKWEKVIKLAEDRAAARGEKPGIFPEDLEKAFPGLKAEAMALPQDDGRQARVRFEFYKRLLLGREESLAVKKLQENCLSYV